MISGASARIVVVFEELHQALADRPGATDPRADLELRTLEFAILIKNDIYPVLLLDHI